MAGSLSDSLTLLQVLTPEGTANLYLIYERIRAEQPVLWDESMQM